MATNSDANEAGFSVPSGSSLISNGDDAIRQNARVALDLYNDGKFAKSQTSGGSGNLDNIVTPGVHTYGSEYLNVPPGTDTTGDVIVMPPIYAGSPAVSQLAIPYGKETGIYYRYKGSAYWSGWERIDGIGAIKQSIDSLADMNDAEIGSVHAFSDATLNGPERGSGTVLTFGLFAASNKQQIAFIYGSTPEIWTRFCGSTGWSNAWVRVDAGAVELPTLTGSASASGMKIVPLALTVGGSPANRSETTTGGVRMPVQFAADVTRYRVHMRNINPRVGTPGQGTVTVHNVWIGDHKGGGLITGSYSPLSGKMVSTGGDMVTPWITTPIEANHRYLITYQWTATEPTHAVVGGGWTTADVADAASNGGTTTLDSSLPLDVWIEAETPAETPVIAAFGDSLSSGVGAALPVYDSWLSAYCRAHGALPVHYTASGDTMQGWADSTHYKWTRWQELDRPDAVVSHMGSNDVFGGTDLATMQDRRAHSLSQLRALVSPVVYSATITPRSGETGAMEDVRRAYNSWLLTMPDESRDTFDFVPVMSNDDETIIPEYDSDSIHLNRAGYAALADSIDRPISSSPTAALEKRIAELESGPRVTGPRNINSLIATEIYDSGNCFIERHNNIVVMYLSNLKLVGSGSARLVNLPYGFKPNISPVNAFVSDKETRFGYLDIYDSGSVWMGRFGDGIYHISTVSWVTDDDWPSTLPGDPA